MLTFNNYRRSPKRPSQPPRRGSVWDDDMLLLDCLDMCERQGVSATEAARILSRRTSHNITRNSVLGIRLRVRNDTDAHDLTPNLNGTMPPRWWERRT